MEAPILKDEFYISCIELAMMSRGKERYGSILTKNGEIIGRGFNRAIAHPSFGKLERVIAQGMANHAEVEAINEALMNGYDVQDSDLFVAGYFPDTGKLFFKKEYTCPKCIPHMRNYGIEYLHIPLPDKWVKKSMKIAENDSQKFRKDVHEKRVAASIGEYYISQLPI